MSGVRGQDYLTTEIINTFQDFYETEISFRVATITLIFLSRHNNEWLHHNTYPQYGPDD